MPKALCIFGMVVAVLILLIFGLDLTPLNVPFGGTHKLKMDLPLVFSALILGYLSWTTLREQD
jgi:hypothetical protein